MMMTWLETKDDKEMYHIKGLGREKEKKNWDGGKRSKREACQCGIPDHSVPSFATLVKVPCDYRDGAKG